MNHQPAQSPQFVERCATLVESMKRLGDPEAAHRWEIAARCGREQDVRCDPDCPFSDGPSQGQPLACVLTVSELQTEGPSAFGVALDEILREV